MKNITGEQFGNWTVLNNYITSETGERKWLCRCVCGTERYVLERSLLYGGSKSCGCLRKENANKARSYDLSDKVFGDLTVVNKAKKQRKNGRIWWTCVCTCENQCDVPATLLITGRKTSCGCKTMPKYASSDIAGKRFRKLTVTEYAGKRAGMHRWRCICDCGNETIVGQTLLQNGKTKSCGCLQQTQILKNMKFVDGTSVTAIEARMSRPPISTNSSGYNGVYHSSRGKWRAQIGFKGKMYYLGSFDSIQDAIDARKEGEKMYENFLEWYYSRKSLE